jgi:esterase/lipase superfamily enzyme
MAERLIWITVEETGSGPGAVFSFHVRLDGEVVAANQPLTPAQSRAVHELSRQYGQLFEQHGTPQLAREALTAIGTQLFDLFLAPVYPRLSQKLKLGDQRVLVIGSDRAVVLNVPWELLRPPGGEAIGADAKWSVRRLPWADRPLDPAEDRLPPGPLRVLYMVAAPRDQADLDFEREEELLLRAFGQAGRSIAFDSGDLGTFDELGERIGAFRPHIVHLTGHGVAKDDMAFFAFEGERGETDERPASDIGQLFAGNAVQCAFLSACQAGRAPAQSALGGLAQGLIAEGVPLVIGWMASVLDDVATELARSFYRALSSGQTAVDRALVGARRVVRERCEARGDPSWSLPVLYAGTQQARVFDPAHSEPSLRPSLHVLQPLPGMLAGYTRHFVGRRRELQQLLPGLRTGELQAVILTGLGGAGKSTLATRLARKLEADGLTPLALSSSVETLLSAGQLLELCGQAFLDAGRRDRYDMLRDASLPVADRLRAIVDWLNRGRFVLVLDNFECNLAEGTRRILDPDLARLYGYLLEHLSGGSRLIVTSRYLPSDAVLPPTALELQLGEFGEAAFLKFLLRDAAVERRYRAGELPHALLVRLHQVLGATPRFLGQIQVVLGSITANELAAELDQVALPNAEEENQQPGQLQAARDAYCETIFTERLYGRLSRQSQGMLSRTAVYGVPVTIDGVAAAAGAPIESVREAAAQWRSLALVHSDGSSGRELWSVYGLLRHWLLRPERLSVKERGAAHLAAGDFLTELERQDCEGELGLSWIACLLEARAQYLAAGAIDRARVATNQISGVYALQGLYAELEHLHQELLSFEEHPDTLQWVGRTHLERADYRVGREYYQRALMRDQQIGDRTGEALSWHQLATIDLEEGAYRTAREKYERARTIRQQIGNEQDEAATWHQLAEIDIREGAYPAAREKSERALIMRQQIGDHRGEAASWHQLATIDLEDGAYGTARDMSERALTIRQQIGHRRGEGATWHQLATIDLREGAYPAAREKFESSLEIKQQIGDRAGEAATWHQLASIDLTEGAYPAAREKFERALRMRQQIGNRAGEAATWHQLGALAALSGKRAEVLQLLGLGYLIHREIGHGDAESGLEEVTSVGRQLGYTPGRVAVMLAEVRDSYAKDHGAELLRNAFGPSPSPGKEVGGVKAPEPEPVFAPAIGRDTEPPRAVTDPFQHGPPRRRDEEEAQTDAEYSVWYGTNRELNDASDPTAGYSSRRDTTVHRGVCRVFIPKSHKIGSIGSPWWKRLLKLTDDRLRLLSVEALQADGFWQRISSHLNGVAIDERVAVIFVHGYNVSFEEAALRAAQMGFDLSIKGAMAFFSWPSQGTLGGYLADAAAIEASEDAIADFMTDFAFKSEAQAVHVIAHSMGNRGVLRAVNRIVAQAETRAKVKFGQVILAAADVDADVFRRLATAYSQVASRTTLYVSKRDLAVEASRWLHDYPRAGLLPPVLVCEHIDTINVTNADLTMLGHGYVADARHVLQDMHDLLVHSAPPQRRFGLREMRNDEGKPFWLIGA